MAREASAERNTKETEIKLKINLQKILRSVPDYMHMHRRR